MVERLYIYPQSSPPVEPEPVDGAGGGDVRTNVTPAELKAYLDSLVNANVVTPDAIPRLIMNMEGTGSQEAVPGAATGSTDLLYKSVKDAQDTKTPLPVPPPSQPLAAPVVPPAQSVPPASPTVVPEVKQLQDLVTPTEPTTGVENQDLGLAAQLPEQQQEPGTPVQSGSKPTTLLSPPVLPPISGPQEGEVRGPPVAPPAPVAPPVNPLTEAITQLRQGGAGLLSRATVMPFQGMAALTALADMGTKAGMFPEGPRQATDALLSTAEKMRQGADFATGAGKPIGPGQQLARIVGENTDPRSAMMTAGMTMADLLSRAIRPTTALAKDAPMDRATAIKLLAPREPGMLESGNINMQNRPHVQNADGSISTVRSISANFGNGEVLIPTVSEDGRIMSDQEAMDQYKRTGKHLGIFDTVAHANAFAQKLHESEAAKLKGPRVTHTIDTAGGPAKVSDGDLKLLGVMGAVTLGALFAPRVIGLINRTPLPRWTATSGRTVSNAAPGTMALSNRMDLARTYDDVNAGILRVAHRAGVDPLTLANVQDTFRIQTGGAARNLVNSAVTNGEMQTPNFAFKTPVSVAQLAKQDSEPFRDYLHARNTFDDILQKEQILQNKGKNAVAQQAAIGPVMVRGMSKQDALNVVNALERAHPELPALSKGYFDNVKEMRRFAATGEYSTISTKNLLKLNQTSKNYVPWKDETGKKRVFDEDVDRLSPFDALGEEMQAVMRKRMENEAKGLYIDAMRKVQPDSYVRITPEQKTNNPHWEQNTVEFYRRGKLESYTTDPFLADVHNLDPQGFTGTFAQSLYASKRLMESTATGVLAPWFAVTSALRSDAIGQLTTRQGLRPPSFIGSTLAVPQQLYPQVARAVHQSLQNGSGGWLEKVLGPQTMQAVSTKMADVYARSFYAQLEKVGTHQGSFMQHAQQFNGAIDKALSSATGTAKTFLNGYKQTLNAIHNSPSFDFAWKNRGALPLPKLAEEARNLTGDPMVTGAFLNKRGVPIRMDKPLLGSTIAGEIANSGVNLYGLGTQIGREAIPWWNITTQGMKRIGEAYVENPERFVAKAAMYQATPAAALFMYTRGLGNDPNGRSYNDYMMNGRSEYTKLMNWYIPRPGRPAEDGIEIPRFHEMTVVAHGMEVALDHVTRSSTFQGGEDFMRAALALVGVKDTFPKDNGGALFNPLEDAKAVGSAFSEATLIPPTPPLANAVLGSVGQVAPQGIFGGGDSYRKKQDPYDQLGGMNATFELVTRALATGMADVVGAGYAAATQTPDGALAAVQNAMKAGGRKMVEKTPIIRNAFDTLPPVSGNTRVTEELFKKEKVINDLSKYYRTWTKAGGAISTKMASERGGEEVERLMGKGPPSESAGIDQPPPTNPLYVAFMEEVYNKFNKDSPDKKVDPVTGAPSRKKDAVWEPDDEGGISQKSMWRRYGDYSTHLKRLRQINDGNNVTWQLQLSQRPEQLKYLKENNVDYQNIRSVRSFYEAKRQDVARQLLFTIRAVEEDFTRRNANGTGQPFKIEQLDPYAKGPKAGEMITDQPSIPPWTDGTGIN